MPDQHDAGPVRHVAVVGHVQDQSFHRAALDEPVEDTLGGLLVRAPIYREPDRQAQRVHALSASLTGDSAIAAFSALVPDGVGSVWRSRVSLVRLRASGGGAGSCGPVGHYGAGSDCPEGAGGSSAASFCQIL